MLDYIKSGCRFWDSVFLSTLLLEYLRFQIYTGKLEFYGHHEDPVQDLGVQVVEKSTRQGVEIID